MSQSSRSTVIVGLSGGVDSAVAAYLLKKQGYSVTAVFMKNWEAEDSSDFCPSAQDLKDAQAVCNHLAIPLETVNFSDLYWDKVFTHFLAEYAQGRTPNPDILCNQEIKFKAFLTYALEQGAHYLATGHYAGVLPTDTGFCLTQAQDTAKDQTYFLYRLSQEALSRTIFPLAQFTKPQVRSLANQLGLPNAEKKDSTGICFIGERKFSSFLSEYLLAKPGPICSMTGEVLGEHLGLMFHTIGQRKGLKIGGLQQGSGEAWYVVRKDIPQNTLIVAQGENHPDLFASHLRCAQLHWITEPPSEGFSCEAKIRYRQPQQPCQIHFLNATEAEVTFSTSQRAITPGQSIVFYQNQRCLGGGVIV